MTEPAQATIARLSYDVSAIGAYLGRVSADLRELERIVGQGSFSNPGPTVAPQPAQCPQPGPPQSAVPVAAGRPARRAAGPRSDGWLGKALAVAGVAVTLVGVALLLVLAAQAGILRPEFRVAAGAALAAGLVGAGWWSSDRRGGRVGAIALAATGVAAAYIDVVALTTIYRWVSAPVGLTIAAVVACSGLFLARRWDSEHLGLLVLVPLIGLAPVITDGVTVLLVAFMLALAAASLPIQLGRNWLGMHAARTAVASLPPLVALVAAPFSTSAPSSSLPVACAVAAAIAIGGALILLRCTANSLVMALLSAAGTVPVLALSLVVAPVVAASMAAVLAVTLLAVVLGGLPMITPAVRAVWTAWAAASTLVAVTVAFDGPVVGPVVLSMAVILVLVSRQDHVLRWCAAGFGIIGGAFYLGYAPVSSLVTATVSTTPIAVSTLIASLLIVAMAVGAAWAWSEDWSWAVGALISLYALTTFAVTAGVVVGGVVEGFFAGHVTATICWIGLAAIVLAHAAKTPRARRSLPIGSGAGLVGAAMAKLFLFDLNTLDGIFRVVVFIVVGLALLGMGAGYARLLAQQDDARGEPASR